MGSTINVNGLSFRKMISRKEIAAKVKEMANDINEEYRGKQVEVIIVLKGAFIFAADLVRRFDFEHNISFIQFSSYRGTETTGIIKERFPMQIDAHGKIILIVEDIVDTGNTLNYFIGKLNQDSPESVDIAAMLFKTDAYKHDFPVKFCGFRIENKFVVGYGLDMDEKARNLKHIYQLDEGEK